MGNKRCNEIHKKTQLFLDIHFGCSSLFFVFFIYFKLPKRRKKIQKFQEENKFI